jgi:AcrR family transcriptional regulator
MGDLIRQSNLRRANPDYSSGRVGWVSRKTGGIYMRATSQAIERLLAAAQQEFGEKGLDGSTIEDIARLAGTSKQLIYHYFVGKEDLYAVMVSRVTLKSFKNLRKIDLSDSSPEESIKRFFLGLMDYFEKNPIVTLITIDQGIHRGAQLRPDPAVKKARNALLNELSVPLLQGQENGTFNKEIDPYMLLFLSIMVATGCLSMRGFFAEHSEKTLRNDTEFWKDFMSQFFLKALRP